MFQLRSWPSVILHLDGDSFFASVAQALNPKLKGKPIVTGGERGVATAVSLEAKKLGIPRAIPLYEIRKKYPQVTIVDSDYEAYDLFSQKMFSILRGFAPIIEEYSIDEAFADLKGLRRPLNMTYFEMAKAVKEKIESSLGISISVGVSLTKSLAKLASSHRKPSGLTLVSGKYIERLLATKKIEDVWGIGDNTSSYLRQLGLKTALDFAQKDETFILKHLSKPFFEIWRELRGNKVYELDYNSRTTYKSITRSNTFYPPTNDREILFARLLAHVVEAFEVARRYRYNVKRIQLLLKTQTFAYHTTQLNLLGQETHPMLIHSQLREAFNKIYKKGVLYRTTGCTISELADSTTQQPDLFNEDLREEKAKKIYPLLEQRKVNFASSLLERDFEKRKRKVRFGLPVLELGN